MGAGIAGEGVLAAGDSNLVWAGAGLGSSGRGSGADFQRAAATRPTAITPPTMARGSQDTVGGAAGRAFAGNVRSLVRLRGVPAPRRVDDPSGVDIRGLEDFDELRGAGPTDSPTVPRLAPMAVRRRSLRSMRWAEIFQGKGTRLALAGDHIKPAMVRHVAFRGEYTRSSSPRQSVMVE